MNKKPPPRPEELDKHKDYRHRPKYAWTPEDGGYRDGIFYGNQDGNGHHPANEERTYEHVDFRTNEIQVRPDPRICASCGTQRMFSGTPQQWHGSGTNCNACSRRLG